MRGRHGGDRRDSRPGCARLPSPHVQPTTAIPHIPVPARVDALHVRYQQATVEQLRIRDQSSGGGVILQQALRHFIRVQPMANESDYTETVGRQLLTAAGALGSIAGWAAFDHDDQRLARHLYNEAPLRAASSGDIPLRTCVWVNVDAEHVSCQRGSRSGPRP